MRDILITLFFSALILCTSLREKKLRTTLGFLILLFVVCLGAAVVSADIVQPTYTLENGKFTIDQPFNVTDSINLKSASITFTTTNITLGTNITLSISGTCTIASSTPITLRVYQLANSAPLSVATLVLSNVKIITTGESITDNLRFDLGTSGALVFRARTILTHSILAANDVLLGGGEISIEAPVALTSSVAGRPVAAITSSITNAASFGTNIPFRLHPANIKCSQFNSRFEFREITSLGSASDTLYFNNTMFSFSSIDLNGGVLLATYSTWSLNVTATQGMSVPVTNTNVMLSTQASVFHFQGVDGILSSIRLKENANLTFAGHATNTVYVSLNTTVIFVDTYQFTLIFASVSKSVNCGSATNTRVFTPATNAPLIKILASPGSKGRASRLDGVWVCNSQGTTARFFLPTNGGDVEYEIPCPLGFGRCFGQASCTNLTLSPCAPACAISFQSFSVKNLLSLDDASSAPASPIASNFTCWDGSCFPLASQCPPFTACPLNLPLRCAGECVALGQQCTPCSRPCPNRCLDGTDQTECDSYNGCAIGMYQCPNMACVSDYGMCSSNTDALGFSKKILKSQSDISDQESSVVSLWYADETLIDAISYLSFSDGALQQRSLAKVGPIADSLASAVNGSRLNKDFDYYHHINTAPFTIQLGEDISTNFGDKYVSIYFTDKMVRGNISNLCLAFINTTSNEWECTDFPLTKTADGLVEGRTNHFTSFAVLTKFNDYGSENGEKSNKSNDDKKRMIIISCSVVGAILVVAVIVGFIVNFKIKNVSLRRWSVHRSDLNLSKLKGLKVSD
eukprot:gene9107-10679_t